jgi:hypothetical protein
MRNLLVVGAVLLAACSSPTDEQGQAQPLPTVATTTTAGTTTTEAATTTRPATTRPIKVVVGKYCAAMKAAVWSFEEARAYYEDHGEPAHMDADGDGIPLRNGVRRSWRPQDRHRPHRRTATRPTRMTACRRPLPTFTAPKSATGLGLTTATVTHTVWTPIATGLAATATASRAPELATCRASACPNRWSQPATRSTTVPTVPGGWP